MTGPLRAMRSGLCGLLVLCVALRLMAWLITPAIPLLVVLLLLVGGLYFLCGRQG